MAALPANGHVVLAGRSQPALDLDRVAGPAGVLEVGEDELRFDEAELAGFATLRGLDPQRLGETGGWPAMAELMAMASGRLAGDYLWEEVLGPVGTDGRRVLAVLCDLGGADGKLASATLGEEVDLDEALRGVPLVDHDQDGWHVPHALWARSPGLALEPTERRDLRRRAAAHLTDRGRYDEAFRLVAEAEIWDAAPPILRAASLDLHHLVPSRLGRWLAACPETVRESLAGCVATSLHLALTRPEESIEPLRQAAARCREEGDVDAEIRLIAQLGVLAVWWQDLASLVMVGVRALELDATGRPRARALAALSRGLAAAMQADGDGFLRELESIEAGALDPSWEGVAVYLSAVFHYDRDEHDLAYDKIDRVYRSAPRSVRDVLDVARLWGAWTEGRIDDALAGLPAAVAAARAAGEPYRVALVQGYAALGHALVGEVERARAYLEEAQAAAPSTSTGEPSVWVALATATVRLAEGDEAAATAVLRRALERQGLDVKAEHREWLSTLPLSYVLVPETRSHWDQLELRGYVAAARVLATAVVSAREGRNDHLRHVDLPALPLIRSLIPVRFAAELALGLSEVGRAEAREVLDLCGIRGRAALRARADVQPRRGKAVRALLAAVPAPPERSTYLAVLGPLVLRRDGRDGTEVTDTALRRKRLQALVGYLVAHRRTTRSAITATLWPELDERSAGNNLAVNLSLLLRVLDPWRDSGEPSYLVRLDQQAITLVTGEHLRIDVDDFETELRHAARAEAEGTPSVALDHLLTAVELYRDDLHAELSEADWFVLDRQHYRTRFVTAATRAGQLLVGRGDPDQAGHVARRALAVDPWSEDAYAVLIGAALAHGDRSGARRILRRCVAALHDLGVPPSPALDELHRRIHGDRPGI